MKGAGSGLGLSYPMYIYMPFLNLKNKHVQSLFKFTYLIIYKPF